MHGGGNRSRGTLRSLASGAAASRPTISVRARSRPGSVASGRSRRALPAALAQWECRNNRLAWHGRRATVFSPRSPPRASDTAPAHRVVIGTSTPSVGATEDAYRRLTADGEFPGTAPTDVHTPHSLADFVQQTLALRSLGDHRARPALRAPRCSPGRAAVRAGLADAAVVGGVDTLCGSAVRLQLAGAGVARALPAVRAARSGIRSARPRASRCSSASGARPWLLGYGESSDAHHMSAPHPDGRRRTPAIARCAEARGVRRPTVDYINLHGTASPKNDEVEARPGCRAVSARTSASSTKGWTGHTLGAAGIVEAAIVCWQSRRGFMPGTLKRASSIPPAVRRSAATTAAARALGA